MNGKVINIATAFKHLGTGRSLGDGIAASFSTIGYKGKVWSLRHQGESKPFLRDDDGTPSPFLDVVIVGISPYTSKIWYEDQYSESDSGRAPDCQSLKGDVPEPGVPKPQSRTCPTCPNDAWGSSGSGKGKACQDHKRLAVLIMPYMTKRMLGAPLTDPVFFKVPAGSLKSLKAYGDELTHQGIHWASVITRVTFDPKRLFEMKFELKQPLTNNEAPVVLPLLEDPATRNIVGGMLSEPVAVPPPIQEPEDTGLLEAFGKAPARNDVDDDENVTLTAPTRRGRGRPPGSTNKPKMIDAQAEPDLEPQLQPEDIQTVAAKDEEVDEETGVVGADDELEGRVNALLQQKVQGMMPK